MRKLEDHNYEIIKAHILSPEASPLSEEQAKILNRWTSMAKLIDLYPSRKDCVSLHIKKENISDRAAQYDFDNAKKLYNSMHKFDYDFWHAWLINDIIRLIKRSRDSGNLKTWAAAQTNLIKTIGEKPPEILDPEILQQHNYFTVINIDGKPIKMTLEDLHKLPTHTRAKLVEQLEKDIDEDTAYEIMNT